MAGLGWRNQRRLVAAVVASVALSACASFPNDATGTVHKVAGGTLRVGMIDNEPWAVERPAGRQGIEVRLVEQLARQLNAALQWRTAPAHELLAALEHHTLDLVVGGLASDDPWGSKVTFTPPYATTKVVVGVPAGQPIPDRIAGQRVAVERATVAEAAVEAAGARPVPVHDLRDARGLVAVEEWLLDDLDLRASAIELVTSHHVFAVPMGENAWLIEVENFLDAHRDQAARLIATAGVS